MLPVVGERAMHSVMPPPPPDQLIEALLQVAPRVAMVARGLLWADARGLPEQSLAAALCGVVRSHGGDGVQAGVARTAIAAEVAATATPRSGNGKGRGGGRGKEEAESVVVVRPGQDRAFLAPYPLPVLRAGDDPSPALLSVLALLAGVGIETCGQLAALGQEEIEVRCGMEGVRLWRLARAEDRRRPFGALPRTLPRSSCAWTDYALRDGERLLFVINRLVGHVCDALQGRGEGAQALLLRFALANRSTVDHSLGAAHPTADRSAWLRLARSALEKLRLPDAVTGITIQVEAVVPMVDQQGDVFDRGFATARATEQAVAQLLDVCGADAVALTLTDHPLLERRALWRVREPISLGGAYIAPQKASPNVSPKLSPKAIGRGALGGSARRSTGASHAVESASTTDVVTAVASASVSAPAPASAPASATRPSLTLQLLPEPRLVRVVTVSRRDHDVPVRYHEPSSVFGTATSLFGAAADTSRRTSRDSSRDASRDTVGGISRGTSGRDSGVGPHSESSSELHGGLHGEPRGGTAVDVLIAVGPDRVEGGSWEAVPFAREYFHCVTSAGRLVLLFQAAGRWYLHGWWD